MVRNAGKFGKPKRGGKKQFTQNLDEIDRAGMWDQDKTGSGSEEESNDDGSEESESEEEEEPMTEERKKIAESSRFNPSIKHDDNLIVSGQNHDSIAQSRAERKKAKNQQKKKTDGGGGDGGSDDEENEADNKELENLNRATKKSLKLSEISKLDVGTPNRKEREAAEKKAAQERYWKLHQAGKTDEAKTDLARLAKIRQEREQAAAFRKAELEAKAKEAAERATLSGRKKK